jgi:O-methyltransferase
LRTEDVNGLVDRVRLELIAAPTARSIGIVGLTPTTLVLLQALESMPGLRAVSGVYCDVTAGIELPVPVKPLQKLNDDQPSIIVIASDEGKEQLLSDAVPFLNPSVRILVGGFAHFEFVDSAFSSELSKALIPSLANGYPNSLIHIYQCLKNAARLGLDGIVAEFGMFKGGTTMLMSRFIEGMRAQWRVYGFDSFSGFPPPRSPLDMYAHPDCVYLDEAMVRRVFEGRNVEIVVGDIVMTAQQIKDKPIVLAFIDTDNFTPATAVLDVIQNNVVQGGAIIFDHFTGKDRFLNTLGERIAAKRLLDDGRYFNLHGTGVFLRQR